MISRWVFPNGLVALYRQDAGMPLAAAALLFRSGSRSEKIEEAGLSNFTFEMLLSGTRRKNARQIADVIESVGASMGAQSAEDYSEIDWLAPAATAEPVFQLMAEVLMQPRWPAGELEKQREHILNDLRTRSDTLFNVAYDAFRKTVFPAHPYGRPVQGAAASIRGFTAKDLARWHAAYVRPDQAVFSLAGPWPAAKARRLIEKILGPWKRRAAPALAPEKPVFALPPQPGPLVLRAAFKQAFFMMGTDAPALNQGVLLPLKLWNMILGGGMSSRLFVQLREERGLAYDVSSFYPARLEAGSWAVYMGLPAERLPEAERALQALLEELAEKGPSAAELQQAKQLMQGSYVMDHQTQRRKAWYAAWWEFLHRPTDYGKEYLRRIEAVTLQDVRAAGRRLLAQPRLTVKVIPK